jgi:sirohydrochlorin cobaltochelatase
MFLADGFFAREVLPEALGLRGPITQLGEQTVFYRPPVGVHPAMATLTLRRALVRELDADERSRAALVIVGHGTLRNAESARAVRVLCERIRRRARFAIIEPAYLDEPPLVAAVVAALPHRNIVVVPYLLSEGWHTRRTIPDALQLSARRTDSAGRVIWYTPAVGTHAQLARVAVACTRSAASRRHRSDVDATTGRRT